MTVYALLEVGTGRLKDSLRHGRFHERGEIRHALWTRHVWMGRRFGFGGTVAAESIVEVVGQVTPKRHKETYGRHNLLKAQEQIKHQVTGEGLVSYGSV